VSGGTQMRRLVVRATPHRYAPAIRAARNTIRYWLPMAAGFGCLIVALSAHAIVGLVLLFVGVGLIFDGVTAALARSGDATEHRQ
jgi:hypothetical protein